MSAEDFQHAFTSAALTPPRTVDGAVWVETDPPETDPVLEGVFDVGDKLMIVGPSKARKSFFALQMAVSLASGRSFAGLPVPKERRVLACQYEIRDGNYHRRLWRLARAANVTGSDLGDRLGLLNLRGKRAGLDAILAASRAHRAEVVLIDPLYKTYAGHDENAAGDMATILAGFDAITEATGGALAYVHHDAKGPAGARDTRDRGSGSGVFARDYDACLTLTPHADDPENLFVVGALLRNYPPMDEFTIEWEQGRFVRRDDVIPMPDTQQKRKERQRNGPTLGEIAEKARHLITGEMPLGEFNARVQNEFGVSAKRAGVVANLLASSGEFAKYPLKTFPRRLAIAPAGKTNLN